jgi:hypothetical protein
MIVDKTQIEEAATEPTAGQIAEYHRLANAWNRKPGQITLREALDRETAERNLLGLLRAHHRRADPDDIALALEETLLVAAEEAADRKGNGKFASFVASTLRTMLDKMREHRLKLEIEARVGTTKVMHEQEVARRKLGALDDSISTGKARREKALPPPDDGRFGSNERGIVKVAGHLLSGDDLNLILDDVPDATKADVRKACMEIGDQFQSKPGESTPLKAILKKRPHTCARRGCTRNLASQKIRRAAVRCSRKAPGSAYQSSELTRSLPSFQWPIEISTTMNSPG